MNRPVRLLAALACCVVATSIARAEPASRTVIDVQETAGIRRFQYPVAMKLKLDQAVGRETAFRLMLAGRPVLVQVRPAAAGDAVAQWWVDFPVDLLPYQSASYELQYGRDVPAAPERRKGLRLVRSPDEFRVLNQSHIGWTVRRDLAGLLNAVHAGEMAYLRAGSPGLALWSGGRRHALAGQPAVSVTREGPLAVGLRFEFNQVAPALDGVGSIVDLTFPVFKSWVEVDWRIKDPHGLVERAEAAIDLNLDRPTAETRTLVDFGTGGLTYLALAPGQETRLCGVGSDWQVLRGTADRLEPFVAGPRPADRSATAEGWLHAMDRRRCLALAVDRFAGQGEDQLSVAAEGRVALRRSFKAPSTGERTCRFWLHMVPFPPQETAATSPQAMQNPLIARVRSEKRS